MTWRRFTGLVEYLPDKAAFWRTPEPEQTNPAVEAENTRRARLELPPRKGHLTLLTKEDL